MPYGRRARSATRACPAPMQLAGRTSQRRGLLTREGRSPALRSLVVPIAGPPIHSGLRPARSARSRPSVSASTSAGLHLRATRTRSPTGFLGVPSADGEVCQLQAVCGFLSAFGRTCSAAAGRALLLRLVQKPAMDLGPSFYRHKRVPGHDRRVRVPGTARHGTARSCSTQGREATPAVVAISVTSFPHASQPTL